MNGTIHVRLRPLHHKTSRPLGENVRTYNDIQGMHTDSKVKYILNFAPSLAHFEGILIEQSASLALSSSVSDICILQWTLCITFLLKALIVKWIINHAFGRDHLSFFNIMLLLRSPHSLVRACQRLSREFWAFSMRAWSHRYRQDSHPLGLDSH